MNFKQYFIEAVGNKCVVIREANEDEIDNVNNWFSCGIPDNLIKAIDKGWIVRCMGTINQIFPNYATVMQKYLDDQSYIIFSKHGRWINYSTDRVPTNFLHNTELKKAIKYWELSKSLEKEEGMSSEKSQQLATTIHKI